MPKAAEGLPKGAHRDARAFPRPQSVPWPGLVCLAWLPWPRRRQNNEKSPLTNVPPGSFALLTSQRLAYTTLSILIDGSTLVYIYIYIYGERD